MGRYEGAAELASPFFVLRHRLMGFARRFRPRYAWAYRGAPVYSCGFSLGTEGEAFCLSLLFCVGDDGEGWPGRRGKDCGFAAEALAQRADPADSLANPLGSIHEMAGGEARQNAVMTYHCECHGGDTAALRAVRLTAKLAGPDAGFEIGGERQCGAGEDAILGGLRERGAPARQALHGAWRER
jgi:hypothetical protein